MSSRPTGQLVKVIAGRERGHSLFCKINLFECSDKSTPLHLPVLALPLVDNLMGPLLTVAVIVNECSDCHRLGCHSTWRPNSAVSIAYVFRWVERKGGGEGEVYTILMNLANICIVCMQGVINRSLPFSVQIEFQIAKICTAKNFKTVKCNQTLKLHTE